MPLSLLDWAAAPTATPSPFPSRLPASFNVGELPTAPLIEDLTRRGFSRESAARRRAVVSGAPVDDIKLSQAAACILTDAADLLEASPEVDAELATRARVEALHAQAESMGHLAIDDPRRQVQRALRREAEDLETDCGNLLAVAKALHATASDIRRSGRAQRLLFNVLIADLPVIAASPAARGLVDAWLAQYDHFDRVKRPDLVRAYRAADSPGGLTADGIRDVARARWGDVDRLHGEDYYRPARRATAPPPDLAAIASLLDVDKDRLAAFIAAEHHSGGLPANVTPLCHVA